VKPIFHAFALGFGYEKKQMKTGLAFSFVSGKIQTDYIFEIAKKGFSRM
jgi:hypothetical protein